MPKRKIKLPLSKTHPNLAKEAYGWDPTTVTKGMTTKHDWICPKGHVYSMSVNLRTRLDSRPRKNGINLESKIKKTMKTFDWKPNVSLKKGLKNLILRKASKK